jgi:preprotein translocase subunit SecD
MRGAVLAAAVAAVILGAGCDDGGKPELRDAIRLKAVPAPGHKVTEDDLDRAVDIVQRRLASLGVDGEVSRRGADTIAVAVPPGVHVSEEAAGLLVKTGLLEFYDFEAALRPPSVTRGLIRAPIAKSSPPAAVPPHSVVVSCKVATGACLSTRPLTTRKVFYLFNESPAMTAQDLELSSVRADVDPNTNQPVVLIQFTDRGKRTFEAITRREAQRGALACAGRRDQQAVPQCAQHFAIVLDHELVSAPYIDFVRNPDGIPADNGAQIDLESLREAKRIAVALQSGALPVQFVRLP